MWDKSLDEGIFLCDHNSEILTANFLSSLSYVKAQLDLNIFIEPSEFITNKVDFISYILLQNSKELEREIYSWHFVIPLSNREENELFQNLPDKWENQFFINKLFKPEAKFDSICARCGNELYIWEDVCRHCIDFEEYKLDKTIPDIGTINCHTCEGFSFTFERKRITYYCEYNTATKKRSHNNCEECDAHFDWLEKKQSIDYVEILKHELWSTSEKLKLLSEKINNQYECMTKIEKILKNNIEILKNNIRSEIESMGGKFFFDTFEDLLGKLENYEIAVKYVVSQF